jgi:drug/metabolite transporter (DMT)-like permease
MAQGRPTGIEGRQTMSAAMATAPTKVPEKLLGHAAALLFSVLIAGSFSIGHLAAPHIGAAALSALRFAIAFALMFGLLLALHRGRVAMPTGPWRYAILGGLMGVYFVTMFVALKITAPVSTGAMFTLIPLMSAGFGLLFLGQRTHLLVLASLLIAAAGALWVIFRADLAALASLEIGRGEAIFFFGCAAHAAYAPLVRRFNRGEKILDFTTWTISGSLVVVGLFALPELLSTDFSALPPIVWIAVLYLSVVTTAGTFFLIQFASMRLPASKVLAYGYLTPSFIILIEGLIGHGWAPPIVMAGAAVTACALVVMALGPDS